ncbi:MAG: carboxymuconolactone decarboxylase family protein [Woeseiaceae bacterium]
MSFIDTTPPDEASGEVLAMYQRQQSAWGYVPNYARVFSHRPEVLARWGRLLAEIRRPMSDRCFELATFAAAIELRNTACSLAHGQRLTGFFSEEEIRGIAAGQFGASVTGAEQAMLRFARQVARDASQVTADDVDALRKHGFTDAEVFDIAATAAGRAFFTKLLDALGVETDASVMQLDKPFRDALTVGRPLSLSGRPDAR